jgi:hypothetical protein
MDHLHYRLNFDEVCRFSVILYYAREIDSPIGCWGINFPFVIQNDWKLQISQGYISVFYNISQRNFGILLILWCSFKLWWNFCLDQNLVYNANDPLLDKSRHQKHHRLISYWLLNNRKIPNIILHAVKELSSEFSDFSAADKK